MQPSQIVGLIILEETTQPLLPALSTKEVKSIITNIGNGSFEALNSTLKILKRSLKKTKPSSSTIL